MALTALSAGTGPAAAIIGGVALLLFNVSIGWLLIVGGFALSFVWAATRFR